MNRALFAIALVVLLAASAAACRRGSTLDEAREGAYQANNLGVALLEQFRYAEAADAFRTALGIDESLAIARFNLSLALLYDLDLQGAAREAAEAARLLPAAPEPHYVLGVIARTENRTADARRELERVRRIDADDVGTQVNLGQIYLEERQYPQAIEALRRAASAEPYNVTAAYNLGLALTRSGQAEEGRRMLERAQTLRSTGYAVTYGTGYLEQGRYAEAIASTGAEAELVDTVMPAIGFDPTVIGPPAPAAATESPFGRRFTAAELTPSGVQAIAAALGGGVAPIDFDADGDLDLFAAAADGQRLWRNDGRAEWTDVTAASGLDGAAPDATAIGCVAGDYDNDGRPDLFVLRYGGSALYHNEGAGRFSDATARAGLPPFPYLPGAAALTDVDHDGDLDLVVAGLADVTRTLERGPDRPLAFPRDFAGAPLQLLRNNGNGTFSDITAAAQLSVASHAIAIVPTDFDNRRDIDLLVVNRDAPPMLFQNRRDGTFRDVAAEVGLVQAVGSGEIAGVTAADLNKDDFPDFFFARAGGGGVFALSDGRGRLTAAPAPEGADGGGGAQFVDYDNDGLLDLLTWSPDGARVFRNLAQRWSGPAAGTSGAASGRPPHPLSPRGLALADFNGDGATDIVTAGAGGVALWRNSGTAGVGRRHLQVRLAGRVSNRLGIGSKVQMRAGSLKGRIETSAATPAVIAADVAFGLGARSAADVVRVLWPSGILQAEALQPPSGSAATSPLAIEELNRKPSSCPFLFTWNGEAFEFVTDFMGAGEMGYWAGPGVYHRPDPLEYVRIAGDQLRPKDGKLELRVTNELEEAVFFDRLHLLAVAHPEDVEVYPNEGMSDPPKPFKLFAVTGSRPPRATGGSGRDLTDRIARVDRQYSDDFTLEPFRGYAAPHHLALDLSPVPDRPLLLLTGWTDYAFSSDNVAAQQAGLALSPPALQIKGADGRWRTAVADIGIPVGRPQTIPIDLAGLLRPGEHQVRIATNMRIYWDRIAVGASLPADSLTTVRLDPVTALLRDRGFSAEVRPDGREPVNYRYDRVTRASPWKVMAGRYTREGDVRELLTEADDMFVIAKPGDELALGFDQALPAAPPGWTSTFLLLADGYSKEMDINSATPDTVEPLPFHAMSAYPYRAPEHYPDSPGHERYRATYNTRAVVRTVPSIDGVLPDREAP